MLDVLSTADPDSVTVIMAAHDAMPYLPLAVDSIMNQRLTNWRLIIVDDASSDDSEAYLQGLTDPRVMVLRLSSNRGQGVARNHALERCDTKYVAVMDADDVSHPYRLAAQIEFLTVNPSVGAVGTQFAYLGTRGRTGFGSPLPCEHAQIYDDLMHGRHAIVNGTVWYRTSLLQSCGGYATSRGGEDLDIYLRLAERSRLANLKGQYYLYRVHDKSTNSTRLGDVQLQYAFVLHNARRRLANLPEVSFESFKDGLRRRPRLERLWSRLDVAARGLYRTGVGDVLHGHPLTGYTRLGVSALMAPGLAMRRLIRVAPPRWRRRLNRTSQAARVPW
jgi:glycosyltransferase involved in cell wall biosynthesis